MGVQFSPLTSFLTPHVGLFWQTIRDRYPTCKEQPTIASRIEDLSKPGAITGDAIFELSASAPLPRVFFESPSGDWLIQLQRDRFLHNWRLVTPNLYPRYPAAKSAFFAEWTKFSAFIRENDLGKIEPIQFEITYLNHIFPWNDVQDIGEVFPDLRWSSENKTIPPPETTTVSRSFVSKDKKSRLRTTMRPARHTTHGSVIVFELTVRGFDADSGMEEWFDRGRAWIVTAFAELTSREWHAKWGRSP